MNLEQIDTSTTAGKAEVMRLAAEGRKVLWRFRGDAQWLVDVGDDWDWRLCEYAIKANPVGPREVWLAILPDGKIKGCSLTKEEAGYFGLQSVRYIRAGENKA